MVQKSAPVNIIGEDLFMSVGERLKEERERLGLTQPAFAAVAGASKRTLIDWEKGATSPSAVQLSAIAVVGADVLYILTGQRSPTAMQPDEAMLLERYRTSPQALRDAALRVLLGADTPLPAASKFSIGGNMNAQVFEGGATNTAPVSFNINKGKGDKN